MFSLPTPRTTGRLCLSWSSLQEEASHAVGRTQGFGTICSRGLVCHRLKSAIICSHFHRHTGSNSGSLPLNTSSASRICQRPNPGFLGASSHSAVYIEIAEDLNGIEQAQNRVERLVPPDTSSTKPLGHLLVKGSELLSRIGLAQRIQNFKTLIQTWRAKGIQLPLGGALLDACIGFDHTLVFSNKTDENSNIDVARQFLVNSMKPLLFDGSTTFRDFCSQFCGSKTRWEIVGLLCTAVARATFDVPILIPLYSTQEQREQLRREMIEASDACLELSLSLDCLNDLQMVLHYENCILYSLYNGDQSELQTDILLALLT